MTSLTSLPIRAYLSTRNYLADLQERRNDKGASLMEYVGVLVLVAIVVGIVVGAVNSQGDTIGERIETLIDSILSGQGQEVEG